MPRSGSEERARICAAAAALVLLLAPVAGRSDGFTGSVEPAFSHTETDVTSQGGSETHEAVDVLSQRYRLALDRNLTDALVASAGATLVDERGWRRTGDLWSDEHGRSASFFGRLSLSTSVLAAGVGVDRTTQDALGSSNPSVVNESYGAHLSWRPVDLPELALRFGRTRVFDESHALRDTVADSATFSAHYGAEHYDVRYFLTWARTDDRTQGSETSAIEQAVLGTRTDTLFRGRTASYVSATLSTRNSATDAHGERATVTRQQLPVGGLSAVETAPATPENVVLSPNALLVDGDVSTSAGVDVGFGRSALGDRDLRDAGAQLADVTTEVNALYVWFDGALGPDAGPALASTVQVFRSDDNQVWAEVTPSAATPSAIENRLEVTLPRTAARYLKVVIRPLDVAVTSDAMYRELFVTELQLLLVRPASELPRTESGFTTSATGYARTLILRGPELAHDVSASFTHTSESDTTRWSLVNGLAVSRRLWRDLSGNARAARQDEDSGRGHEGLFQWSAAVTGRPLPAAHWTLTYSGSRRDTGGGVDVDDDGVGDDATLVHSLSALGRADWYDGISTQASAGVSQSTAGVHTGQSGQLSATTSLVPNRWATLTVGGLYSRSLNSTPELGDVVTELARVDASLSLTPAPALSGSGTVSRTLLGDRRSTLGTFQLDWFPLRGDLQVAIAFSNTLDTAAESTTRLFTPSLRWNVRRGVALTSSLTWVESDGPVQRLSSRSFLTSLLITL